MLAHDADKNHPNLRHPPQSTPPAPVHDTTADTSAGARHAEPAPFDHTRSALLDWCAIAHDALHHITAILEEDLP